MNIKRTDGVFVSISGERFTPFLLARKLKVKAILESASFLHGRERYSILMLDEAFRVIQDKGQVYFLVEGEKVDFIKDESISNKSDILDALLHIANENPLPPYGVPVPASGIGYLSYEFLKYLDGIIIENQKDEINIYESEFIVGHIYIVFDHFTETIHIIGLNYNEHEIDLNKEIDNIKNRLNDLDFTYLTPFENTDSFSVFENESDYIEKASIVKENIINGNLLEASISKRIKAKSDINALEIYKRMRSVYPSPYMVYLNYGSHEIVAASNESLIRVRDSIASIRVVTDVSKHIINKDEILKNDILTSRHAMLVDLARGDLNRVCMAGSVKVVKFLEVETFEKSGHIVSDVAGQIETKGIDVLRVSFPSGSVSGIPKIKAAELITSLEKVKRNLYGGAIGYIEADGDLDFCIAIRCVLKKDNVLTLQNSKATYYNSDLKEDLACIDRELSNMLVVLKGDLR